MKDWLIRLSWDPNNAVDELISGRAGVSFEQLDMPERLFQELPDTPENSALRKQLDCGLYNWLAGTYTDREAEIDRLGVNVYSYRVCQALTTIKLLNLTKAIEMLCDTPNTIIKWLTPLSLSTDRDPLNVYLSFLPDPSQFIQVSNG